MPPRRRRGRAWDANWQSVTAVCGTGYQLSGDDRRIVQVTGSIPRYHLAGLVWVVVVFKSTGRQGGVGHESTLSGCIARRRCCFQRRRSDVCGPKKDAGVALNVSEPDIKLEGQDALMTNANVHLAKTHINQKVYAALQSAIDPAKLKAALPKDLQKMNMTVVSARFRSYGGHAIAEINLAAASAPYTQ